MASTSTSIIALALLAFLNTSRFNHGPRLRTRPQTQFLTTRCWHVRTHNALIATLPSVRPKRVLVLAI